MDVEPHLAQLRADGRTHRGGVLARWGRHAEAVSDFTAVLEAQDEVQAAQTAALEQSLKATAAQSARLGEAEAALAALRSETETQSAAAAEGAACHLALEHAAEGGAAVRARPLHQPVILRPPRHADLVHPLLVWRAEAQPVEVVHAGDGIAEPAEREVARLLVGGPARPPRRPPGSYQEGWPPDVRTARQAPGRPGRQQ